MSKKKHHHEEHEEHVNHEAWVIPYADMLTLLMALFLVMWATGQTDMNKMKQVAAGFADSLGISGNGQGVGGVGVLDGGSEAKKPEAKVELTPKVGSEALAALETVHEQQQQQQEQQQQLTDIQKAITASAAAAGQNTELAFRDESRGLVVSIVSDGVLFDPGSDELRPEGRAVLDNIAGVLNAAPNRIAIEGHTDDRPISTARFPSNLYLSAGRAITVLNYLATMHHIDPKRMSAAGYGDQQPIASNADDAGRARNRRVEIAVLSEPTAPVTTETTTPENSAGQDAPATKNHQEGSP